MVASPPNDMFVLPDPGQAGTFDELIERLRALRIWAGEPSYAILVDRINDSWRAAGRPAGELTSKSTVVGCFKSGRRRLNSELLIAIVQALHPDVGYVAQWRQALRVISGETEAAAQVRVQDSLPSDLTDFTGRALELDRLRQALHRAQHDGGAVVISAIEGMAGVGKTHLAIRAAHLLTRERPVERVLFVNLRGFGPDPAQPPADPAAVLDGFLRLLGVPGQQVPHSLDARSAAYRRRLAGTHALVVLDNAADADQVRPLLADTPGCLTLVTSRRSLTDLRPATRLTVDVFTPEEANGFLTHAVPDVPAGADPHAAARIAERCGHLPLALSLVAAQIRAAPGWTLTDHADRLDERHRHRHLDSGVQLALELSYQNLPADRQRLLRLAALQPGQDFDAYAAAALTGTGLPATEDQLRHLYRDHLLQQAAPGRYSFHDLVRAYAADRAVDEDRPSQRHAALNDLFDFYIGTAATAMDAAYPHERQHRPSVAPAGTATPDLSDRHRAERWLDAELANLLAVAQHAAQHGRHEHTWQLSAILGRHLLTRGRYRDSQSLHQNALNLARQLSNRPAEMNALNGLGYIQRILGRCEGAGHHFERALQIAHDTGDRAGELQALTGLGDVDWMLGRHEQAAGHYERALQIAQDIGDRVGERTTLTGLGNIHRRMGRYEQTGDHYERALQISQNIGDRHGELYALAGLGDVHRMLGRHEQAADDYERALRISENLGDRIGQQNALTGLGGVHRMLGRHERAAGHYERALRIARDIGHRVGELYALNCVGHVHRVLGHHEQAADCYRQVLDLARSLGNSNGQFEALQGLGRLLQVTDRSDLALTHHAQALQLATDLNQPTDQARAHDGLAHAHHSLHHHDQARRHWQHALDTLTSLGTDHTEEPETSVPSIRAHLTNLDRLGGTGGPWR